MNNILIRLFTKYDKTGVLQKTYNKHRIQKEIKPLILLEIAMFALSIIFILKNNLIISIAFFMMLIIIFIFLRKENKNRKINEDTYEFILNLIYWYKTKQSKQQLIIASLSKKFYFYNEMIYALKIYNKLGNAEAAFKNIVREKTFYFQQVVNLLIQSIDKGIDIYEPLNEIKRQFDIEKKYISKALASMHNSQSMMQLGSSIFFPIFAGISMNILKFTSQMNNIKFDLQSFSMLFVTYIAIINFINFRYKNSSITSKTENIMVFTLFSILLFKVSSFTISHSMLI